MTDSAMRRSSGTTGAALVTASIRWARGGGGGG
jgi:hypothetical protein